MPKTRLSEQPKDFPLKGVYQVEHDSKGPKDFMIEWNDLARRYFKGKPTGPGEEKVMLMHMKSLGWTIHFTNPVNACGNC